MMSNANMFVMYASANGQNVTVSHRTTSGHVMPTYKGDTNITLLEGSGISNGKMTANVRCTGCVNLSAGSAKRQAGSSASDWVYAHLQGSPLNSDDLNAAISQHDGHGNFQWTIAQATGGPDVNPFLNAASSNTTTSSGGAHTQSSSRMVQAHGALAALVFVGILPIGAILVRLAGHPWIHGGVQIFGYVLFIAAAGVGIYIANQDDYLHEPHAVMGLLLLAVLFFMPILGTLHHRMFAKVQKRTAWTYGHIFTGRIAVILGMINGGLGLQLADAGRASKIAYGVLAGLMGIVYLGVAVFGELKRDRKPADTAAREPKERGGEDSGSDTYQ